MLMTAWSALNESLDVCGRVNLHQTILELESWVETFVRYVLVQCWFYYQLEAWDETQENILYEQISAYKFNS